MPTGIEFRATSASNCASLGKAALPNLLDGSFLMFWRRGCESRDRFGGLAESQVESGRDAVRRVVLETTTAPSGNPLIAPFSWLEDVLDQLGIVGTLKGAL
jgi:hypothetical protein